MTIYIIQKRCIKMTIDCVENIIDNEFINAFDNIDDIKKYFALIINKELEKDFYPCKIDRRLLFEGCISDSILLLTVNTKNNYKLFNIFYIVVKEFPIPTEIKDYYLPYDILKFNMYTYPNDFNEIISSIEKITHIEL